MRAPWWFILLIVVALVPVFATPAMIIGCPADNSALKAYLWMYPVAMIASAYYSWVSYRVRQLLAWVMVIFMYLIDASMIYLYLA